MAIGIRPDEQWEYVPIEDREKPVEEQTIFVFRTMNASEVVRVLSEKERNAAALLTLKLGLVGWRNFKDKNGKEITFRDDFTDFIPFELWTELEADIVKGQTPNAELKKSSK